MNKKGFTLIELLVVIVIIGILATISVATFSGYFEQSRNAKRATQINQWEKIFFVGRAQDKPLPALYAGSCTAEASGTLLNQSMVDQLCPNCDIGDSVCSGCLGDYSDDECWGHGTVGSNNYTESPYFLNKLRTEFQYTGSIEGDVGNEAYQYEGFRYDCFNMGNETCENAAILWFEEGIGEDCNGRRIISPNYANSGATLCVIDLE